MYWVFQKKFDIICDVLGVSKKIDIIWDVLGVSQKIDIIWNVKVFVTIWDILGVSEKRISFCNLITWSVSLKCVHIFTVCVETTENSM